MFGRNGRFPHDLVISGEGQPGRHRNVKSDVQQHQLDQRTARAIAIRRKAEARAGARCAHHPRNAFEKPLGVGHRVLVGRHGNRRRAKKARLGEAEQNMVIKRPYAGQPVYAVRDRFGRERVLHHSELKHCP